METRLAVLVSGAVDLKESGGAATLRSRNRARPRRIRVVSE